jgi:hypothetical protein
MDLTEQNLAMISSIRMHNMTIEELVEADRRAGSHLHFSDGVWWREVKPFFYLPANFMTRIVPHQAKPKPWLALGGYYHMVPPGAPSNGVIVTNEILVPNSYGLHSLQPKKRQQIRRILSLFRIARVENLNDLLTDGFRIYLDWKQRKNPRVKRSRAVFERWITKQHLHPYKLILGIYAQEQLTAFLIADAVEGVANAYDLFADSSFERLAPSLALRYAYAKIAAQSPGIRNTCDGFRTLIESLEHVKSLLGWRHVSYPAFISLPSVFRPIIRWLLPMEHRRLMGQYATEEPVAPLPPTT